MVLQQTGRDLTGPPAPERDGWPPRQEMGHETSEA